MTAAPLDPPAPSHRSDPRAGARVPVSLRTSRETRHGLVLDISASGARLFMDDTIDCGGEMLMRWLDHDVMATVVWSRQFECGVHFGRPLDPATLRAIGAALTGAAAPQPEPEAAPVPVPAPVPAPVKTPAPRATRTTASLIDTPVGKPRKQALKLS